MFYIHEEMAAAHGCKHYAECESERDAVCVSEGLW